MNGRPDPGFAIEQAAEYLQSHGFRVLDRRWRCPEGELDIVATERHILVVCDVKTRSGRRYRTTLEAVSRARRNRIRKLAIQWLNAHGVRFDELRVDVIGLVHEGTGGFTIEHVRGVA
jgi:putative endonuclease